MTFKDFQNKIAGKGYTKGFLPINSRATNDFANKKTIRAIESAYYLYGIFGFFLYIYART